MKRPVKENITKDMDSIEIALTIQWNNCCDDWEKYWEEEHTLHIESEKELCKLKESLPTVEEIEKILIKKIEVIECNPRTCGAYATFKGAAKAIHKSLTKE